MLIERPVVAPHWPFRFFRCFPFFVFFRHLHRVGFSSFFVLFFLPQGRPLESTEKRPLAVFLINENAFFSLCVCVCVCVCVCGGGGFQFRDLFFSHLFKLFIGNQKKGFFFWWFDAVVTPPLRAAIGDPSTSFWCSFFCNRDRVFFKQEIRGVMRRAMENSVTVTNKKPKTNRWNRQRRANPTQPSVHWLLET